ncbi:Protein of unknown function (DUF3159) [Frankia torreyi]|uniref:DUF3159 domain-containing protein n=1 Tax=Frankia torreyi TaxID=1856 RepID=A0A0D8B9X0_9ACTN|nr:MULTISPECIES: DUF3159 domain-containing protein [Frankia]KJE20714.1 Protein of unknown function (DUF3159) [Frankia torreyi]KQC39130.1 hypothetical protein UK82_05530 [Frankia sp. ACN1ag]KQM03013.1 Protein of unknown function (DUF3159) [Frankia sp. CpI1-P]
MPRLPTPDAPPMTMSEAIGGPRGIIDSSIPTVAFVTVNAEAGLTAGIAVAIAAALGLLVLRIVRREPTQQTFSGLFAVAVAAFVASRTGDAKGFFLPGIAKNALGVVVALLSVVLRRPIAGYLMAGLDARYVGWKDDPRQRRAAVWATLVWGAVFALRFGVQGVLYLADESGWLAAANIALGLPLFGLAVLASFAIVRRLAPLPPEPPAASGAAVVEGEVVEGEVVRADPPSPEAPVVDPLRPPR